MDKPSAQDSGPDTLDYERPTPTSLGVSFLSVKLQNKTHVTFNMSTKEEIARFAESFGSRDPDFAFQLVHQMAKATPNSRFANNEGIQFMISVATGLKPRDQTEAMIGAQMATVHSAMMTAANLLAHAETIAERDSEERAVNKLARTFATLVDCLKRYRGGGGHNVVVQHVTIAEGDQAIVRNLPRSARKSKLQKPARKAKALIDGRLAVESIQGPTRARVPLDVASPSGTTLRKQD